MSIYVQSSFFHNMPFKLKNIAFQAKLSQSHEKNLLQKTKSRRSLPRSNGFPRGPLAIGNLHLPVTFVAAPPPDTVAVDGFSQLQKGRSKPIGVRGLKEKNLKTSVCFFGGKQVSQLPSTPIICLSHFP